MKLSLHMHNFLGQSNQMHSPLGVFVRFNLICLIKFSTKNIKNTCANSHNKCSNYLINIFTITFGCICLVAQKQHKNSLIFWNQTERSTIIYDMFSFIFSQRPGKSEIVLQLNKCRKNYLRFSSILICKYQ